MMSGMRDIIEKEEQKRKSKREIRAMEKEEQKTDKQEKKTWSSR